MLFVVLLTSAVCFLSFGWALRGHFTRDAGMSPGMRLLSGGSLLSYACFAALLGASGPRPVPMIALADCCFLASLALFWWTVRATRATRLSLALSAVGPVGVNDRGPYALVRHPFYLCYLIFWVGTAVAAGQEQWLPVLMMIVCYVAIARCEEHRFETGPFAAPYRRYRRRTGMLLPRLSALMPPARSAYPGGWDQLPQTADCELSTRVR